MALNKVISRTNLITNPTFETNTTDWYANGHAISRSTAQSYFNTASMLLTSSAGTTNAYVVCNPGNLRISVVSGKSYTFSYYIKSGTSTAQWFASLHGTNVATGGSWLAYQDSTPVTISSSIWTRISVTWTIPSGVSYVEAWAINATGGATGQTAYIDAALLEQSTTVGDYFDGSTAAVGNLTYAWTGTANASTSVQYNPLDQATENLKVNTALSRLPLPHITGMKLQGDISIGSLTLNTIDTDGVVWVCTDIEGWWTAPDPELQDVTRGWGDGSYDARGRYTARVLTLKGTFLTQDPSQVEKARNTLISATDLVYTGNWLVVNETIPKAAYVRLSGRPEITTVNARGRTDFSIQLKAPDPIKYQWSTTNNGYLTATIPAKNTTSGATGTLVINNLGNTKVPVVFQITGTLTGNTTITNTTTDPDEVITILGAQSFTSGAVLELDTYNKEALLVNGSTIVSARSKVGTLIDWIYLYPGANTIVFQDLGNLASSTAVCTVLYRSGWIG